MVRALVVILSAIPLFAWAAERQNVVLEVQGMTCSMCPITVKEALRKTKGVAEVRIDYDGKTATVIFDASQVTVERLVRATTDAGYPATIRK